MLFNQQHCKKLRYDSNVLSCMDSFWIACPNEIICIVLELGVVSLETSQCSWMDHHNNIGCLKLIYI